MAYFNNHRISMNGLFHITNLPNKVYSIWLILLQNNCLYKSSLTKRKFPVLKTKIFQKSVNPNR